MTNPSDGFFSGGGKSLSFGNPSDPASQQYMNRWRGGKVLDEGRTTVQTNIDTGAPVTDKSGKVKEQLVVPLLCDGGGEAARLGLPTNERNPNDYTDDGRRQLYIKGTLRVAVGDELRRAGAPGLRVGGELYVRWVGMGKAGNTDFIGRLWEVRYIPPTQQFFADQGAMPVQQNAQGQYAPQHTGFQPTQTPVTNPHAQPAPAGSGQYAPQHTGFPPATQTPNPYAAPTSVQQHYAPTQQQGGAFPAGYTMDPNFQMPTAPQPPEQPATPQQVPTTPSNPWGSSPAPAAPTQAPYGQAQQPESPSGNPWV